MTTVNTHEAKTHLSRLLKRVAAGEEIIIAKAGKAVARLVPLESDHHEREMGFAAGELVIAEDFDAPLPSEILEAFHASSST